jgi:hypothetical protein
VAYAYFGSGMRFLIAFLSLCLVLLFIILNFSTPVVRLFHAGPDVISYHKLQYCLLFAFGLVAVHSVCKYLGYAISPHGKIYVPERFLAIYVLAESMLWLMASLGFFSLVVFFALYFVILSLISILYIVILSRNHSFFKDIFKKGSFKDGFKCAGRSVSFIINNFCEKFTVDGLTFVVSTLFSAVMVSVYSTIRTLANFMVTGTNMVVATFTIEYQKHSINNDGKALFNLFNATWLLVGFIINYGIVVFYPFLPDIFMIWTKHKLVFDERFFDYIIATSIFIVYGSNIITYLKSVNRLKEVFAVSITRATLLLSLIIIFPKQLEYIGLSLLITEFVVNILLLNFMLYRELAHMQYGFMLGKIFWSLLPFIVTSAYILTNRLVDIEVYIKMTLTLVVITIVYLLQIKNLDNEALIIRLQTIKYKFLNLFR